MGQEMIGSRRSRLLRGIAARDAHPLIPRVVAATKVVIVGVAMDRTTCKGQVAKGIRRNNTGDTRSQVAHGARRLRPPIIAIADRLSRVASHRHMTTSIAGVAMAPMIIAMSIARGSQRHAGIMADACHLTTIRPGISTLVHVAALCSSAGEKRSTASGFLGCIRVKTRRAASHLHVAL